MSDSPVLAKGRLCFSNKKEQHFGIWNILTRYLNLLFTIPQLLQLQNTVLNCLEVVVDVREGPHAVLPTSRKQCIPVTLRQLQEISERARRVEDERRKSTGARACNSNDEETMMHDRYARLLVFVVVRILPTPPTNGYTDAHMYCVGFISTHDPHVMFATLRKAGQNACDTPDATHGALAYNEPTSIMSAPITSQEDCKLVCIGNMTNTRLEVQQLLKQWHKQRLQLMGQVNTSSVAAFGGSLRASSASVSSSSSSSARRAENDNKRRKLKAPVEVVEVVDLEEEKSDRSDLTCGLQATSCKDSNTKAMICSSSSRSYGKKKHEQKDKEEQVKVDVEVVEEQAEEQEEERHEEKEEDPSSCHTGVLEPSDTSPSSSPTSVEQSTSIQHNVSTTTTHNIHDPQPLSESSSDLGPLKHIASPPRPSTLGATDVVANNPLPAHGGSSRVSPAHSPNSSANEEDSRQGRLAAALLVPLRPLDSLNATINVVRTACLARQRLAVIAEILHDGVESMHFAQLQLLMYADHEALSVGMHLQCASNVAQHTEAPLHEQQCAAFFVCMAACLTERRVRDWYVNGEAFLGECLYRILCCNSGARQCAYEQVMELHNTPNALDAYQVDAQVQWVQAARHRAESVISLLQRAMHIDPETGMLSDQSPTMPEETEDILCELKMLLLTMHRRYCVDVLGEVEKKDGDVGDSGVDE